MDNLSNKQDLEKARIRRKTLKKKKRIRRIERIKRKLHGIMKHKKIMYVSLLIVVFFISMIAGMITVRQLETANEENISSAKTEDQEETVSIVATEEEEKMLNVEIEYSEEENISTLEISSSVPIVSAKKVADNNTGSSLIASYIVYSLEDDESLILSEDKLEVTKEYDENTEETIFLNFEDGTFESVDVVIDEIVDESEIENEESVVEETVEDTSSVEETNSSNSTNTNSSGNTSSGSASNSNNSSSNKSSSSSSNSSSSNSSSSNTSNSSSSGSTSSGSTSSGSTSSSSSYSSKYQSFASSAKEMLTYINSFRQENGLSTLSWSSTLANYALIRADEIVSNFSHTRPDGTTALSWSIVYAENLGYCSNSSVSMMAEQFESSSAHRATLLNSMYKTVGVACVKGNDGNYYWVELFGL